MALVVAALASTSSAWAQVRWDLGMQAGATDRIAIKPAPARTPGPSAEIHAHVALYPMLRVGAYAGFDLSPTSGLADRRVYAAGVRLKITPPWLATPWHAWGILGFGIAYAYVPGSPSSRAMMSSMAEVPVGAGLSHRLRGPWDFYTELTARWELGALGSTPLYAGNDLLAVSLGIGVSLSP